MTVTCPSCEARFRDPPKEVLTSAKLQCSKCEHEWSLVEIRPRIKLDTPSMAPMMKDLRKGPDIIKSALPVVMPEPEKHDEPQPVFIDRDIAVAKSKPFSLVGPVAGLACLLVLAGGIGLRQNVIEYLPATKAYYQSAGLITNTPELEIANVVTERSSRDGIRQLIVKGEIQNIANSTVPVPPIKLTMRGEVDTSLFAWTVTAKKNSLKAGEKSRFTAIAHDFPKETVNVEVEFAPSKAESE